MAGIGIKEVVKNNLVWRKFVTVHSDGYQADVTTLSKDEYTKEHNYWKIESIHEVNGNPNGERCPICHKKFQLGDKVVKRDFTTREISFLDKHLAYFKEAYTGDDFLDTHEQCQYLVHADHVTSEQITEYQRGQMLWKEGMDICYRVQKDAFRL